MSHTKTRPTKQLLNFLMYNGLRKTRVQCYKSTSQPLHNCITWNMTRLLVSLHRKWAIICLVLQKYCETWPIYNYYLRFESENTISGTYLLCVTHIGNKTAFIFDKRHYNCTILQAFFVHMISQWTTKRINTWCTYSETT